MEPSVKGTLWIILLLTPPFLNCSPVCLDSCQCKSLGHITCRGRNGVDVLQQLTIHTYTLLLDNASMNVINEMTLAEKSLLVRFGLTNSHLHTIHPLAFRAAPQLKSVMLTNNDLSTLPVRVFSPLTVVEEIYLNGNQLEIIGPDMFDGLSGLLILDLSRNKIRNLPSDMFDGLTNLFLLNLGRNNIKKLAPTMFHSLSKLRLLRIYHNKLEVLEAGIFDRLVNLEALDLHHNQIKTIPPRVFWSLGNLMDLTMSSNRLKGVPHRSFYNMPKLKRLTIYSNPLLSLPEELMGHMPNITQFYLFDTHLTTVPGNLFANMSGLLDLNFHLNDLLRYLPPDLFCCLPNLKKLSLRKNSLQDLHPNLFSTLTTLETLLLQDNKLKTLPESIFQKLTLLVTIDLTNNNLNTLPGDIFLSNTALKALNLSGNPWDCNCAIRGFARWIRQNEHVVLDKDDVICHNPLYKLLRGLHSLHEDDFSACDDKMKKSLLVTQPDSYEQTPYYTSVTLTKKSTTLETTTCSAEVYTTPSSQPDKRSKASHVFHDMLVVEQGPAYVHHNFHNGWVYVWFLPFNSALVGPMMFCYVLLLAVGLILILSTIYGIYRLGTAMDKLKAGCSHKDHAVLSGLVHT